MRGWTEKTDLNAVAFARQVESLGVRNIIFTDVATDGMLKGPNLEAIRAICEGLDGSCNVIASGGVSDTADIAALRCLAAEISGGNLVGVIVGKALYDGRLSLADLEKPAP